MTGAVGLRDRGLSWEVPLSVLMHGAALGAVLVAHALHPDESPMKPPEAIVVEMVGPAVQKGRMPQKAERAPDAARGAPDVQAPPQPTRPDQLVMERADAERRSGEDTRARQQALDEIRRMQALRDLDAPVGATDRAATSPDGSEGGDGRVAQAGVRDPALAKWVREAEKAINLNHHPLPAHCKGNPDLTAYAQVPVDGAGAYLDAAKLVRTSGNTSFDDACLRAFQMTGRLPPTPPSYPDGLDSQLRCVCPR